LALPGAGNWSFFRAFQDGVLQANPLGPRFFIRSYYRYSPAAAEWLIAHPGLKTWVLQKLFWVQVWAWLALKLKWIGLGTLVLLIGWRRFASEAPRCTGPGCPWLRSCQSVPWPRTILTFRSSRRSSAVRGESGELPGDQGSLIEKRKAELGPPDDSSIIEEVAREAPGVIPAALLKPEAPPAQLPPPAQGESDAGWGRRSFGSSGGRGSEIRHCLRFQGLDLGRARWHRAIHPSSTGSL
jgi:hypothetical protein